MSNPKLSLRHSSVTWRAALKLLSAGGLRVQHLLGELNQAGDLLMIAHPLPSATPALASSEPPTEDVEEERTAPLISFVHSDYQRGLLDWLNASWDVPYASVVFPLVHSPTQRERWVCLALTSLSDSGPSLDASPLLARSFVLSDVNARFYQERLAARNSGLLGFKHDLANQIFLFKALPELVEFSSPDELIEDLLVGIPPFLNFLERRLAPEWTEALLIKSTIGAETICAELTQWIQHCALPQRQWQISSAGLSDLAAPSMTTLGVCWSLTQLAWRIRRGEVAGTSQNALIEVSLSAPPQLTSPVVGDCGQLLHQSPQLELSLTVEGWDLTNAMDDWHSGIGWCGSSSSAQRREATLAEYRAMWIGSWVSAAHLTRGVVRVTQQRISIIC